MFLQGWINGFFINESTVYGTLCIVLLKILNMGLYFSEIDTRGWPYRRQDLLLPFNHSFAVISEQYEDDAPGHRLRIFTGLLKSSP